MSKNKKSEKIINVSVPFECPFNVGFCCCLDENVEMQLECMETVPASCPLILNDYKVILLRDRAVK